LYEHNGVILLLGPDPWSCVPLWKCGLHCCEWPPHV